MNRPRPVLTKAGISGLITAIAGVLTFLGYSQQATDLSASSQSIGSVAIAVVLLASHLLPALSAQKEVTPKNSPMDDRGVVLVPADSVVPPFAAPAVAPLADVTQPDDHLTDGLIPLPPSVEPVQQQQPAAPAPSA